MNITQDFIASKIGFSQSHYAKLENGKVKMSIDTITKIADVLKVRVSDLITD